MLDIVGIGVLQAEVILLDQIQRIENLLVQITRQGFFLQRNRKEREKKRIRNDCKSVDNSSPRARHGNESWAMGDGVDVPIRSHK